jgi:hypothetical protein
MGEREENVRSSTRAYRRHQRLRMLDRALRSLMFSDMTEAERGHRALRQLDHLKNYSCWMCGNPRKYMGERTIQERRRIGAMRDGEGLAWERD